MPASRIQCKDERRWRRVAPARDIRASVRRAAPSIGPALRSARGCARAEGSAVVVIGGPGNDNGNLRDRDRQTEHAGCDELSRMPRVPPILKDPAFWLNVFIAAEWAVRLAMIVIVPFRRSPEAAKGWLLLIFFEPTAGLLLYLLIGRPSLPEWRMQRSAEFDALSKPTRERLARDPNIFHPDARRRAASTACGWPRTSASSRFSAAMRADILADYDGTIDRLVADIDAARDHVHLLYYIIGDDDTVGTRRRCAGARGRPRPRVPRARGLAGVATGFAAAAAATAEARHPRRGNHARRVFPPQAPAASTCATIARSRSSTARSATSVRRISSIRRSNPDSTTRSSTSVSRARSRSNCRRSSPKTGISRPANFSASLRYFPEPRLAGSIPAQALAERSRLSARKQPAPDRVADPRGKPSASSSPCRT